jgi:hypothetical protein
MLVTNPPSILSAEFRHYGISMTLDGPRPPVWRRFLIAADVPVADLHRAIRDACGWGNPSCSLLARRGADRGVAGPGLGRRGRARRVYGPPGFDVAEQGVLLRLRLRRWQLVDDDPRPRAGSRWPGRAHFAARGGGAAADPTVILP